MHLGGSVGAAAEIASDPPPPSRGGSGSTAKRGTVQTTFLVMLTAPADVRSTLTVDGE